MYTICSPENRFKAWLLDTLIIIAAVTVLSSILNKILPMPLFDAYAWLDIANNREDFSLIITLGTFISLLLVSISYLVILPLLWTGQTIGRSAVNIKVVKENNKNATFEDFFLRDFVGTSIITTLLIGLCCLGFLINIGLCYNNKNTVLADIIAKTKLVNIKIVEDDPDDLSSLEDANLK